ncbi:Ig-like domain-containing protein [Rathayibacter sp. SD072]|uniref:Ig-like domain-containing protein n=1 Tax=Rathayibacter sp. SD072 TaxID=2781731 RepID=UPI001A9678AF|nr:Ig-like domain-containing protein [Rathayibacter sp. SD072]MBO0985330.1 hypothetical protein [Rathayibacter sp. SD072]
MARATPSNTLPPPVPSADAFSLGTAGRAKTTLLRALALTAAVTIAVTGLSLQGAPAASAAETAFGPDGTHYPSDTPDIRSGFEGFTVVDVAASGPAIRRALDALTPAEIAAGAVIRVAPGHISDLSAVSGYRNTGATKVLVTARDGFQSVTGGDWALRAVTGITLLRFDIDSLDVKGATHSSFARLRINENWIGLAASANVPVRDVELIEVVVPQSMVKSGDTAQIKAFAPNVMSDVLVEGAYLAPSYYVDALYGGSNPARPHTDTLQIEGGGVTGQVTLRDTVVFSSNNSAVIIGGVRNVAFEESLVVGGSTTVQRYPFLRGGAGAAGAINGPGSLSAVQGSGGGNVDASDSTLIGSLQPVWDSVVNTRTNMAGKTARTGGFTVDPTLSSTTAAGLDAMSTPPTTAYLAAIWDDIEEPSTPEPTPEPTVEPTPAPSPEITPEPTPTGTPTEAPTATPTPSPTAPGNEAPAEEEEPDEPAAPVADTTAPTVAITSPLPGAVLSGTTTATVSATDDTEVTGVAFYIGSLKVGDGVRTTGSTWSLTTSTGGMRGTFPLTARATDAAGNTTASAPVTVTLK